MVASVASFGGLNLIQGLTARAVSPTAVAPVPDAPISRDRPHPQAQHIVSAVAFAPAAMAALIEAQERESKDAAPLERLRTVHVLDELIASLDGAPTTLGSPASTQRLQTARQRLVAMTIAA